eukprot:6975804-Prymnesium_polylepis.1
MRRTRVSSTAIADGTHAHGTYTSDASERARKAHHYWSGFWCSVVWAVIREDQPSAVDQRITSTHHGTRMLRGGHWPLNSGLPPRWHKEVLQESNATRE